MKYLLTRIAEVSAEIKWRLTYARKNKTLVDLAGRPGLLALSLDRQG